MRFLIEMKLLRISHCQRRKNLGIYPSAIGDRPKPPCVPAPLWVSSLGTGPDISTPFSAQLVPSHMASRFLSCFSWDNSCKPTLLWMCISTSGVMSHSNNPHALFHMLGVTCRSHSGILRDSGPNLRIFHQKPSSRNDTEIRLDLFGMFKVGDIIHYNTPCYHMFPPKYCFPMKHALNLLNYGHKLT